jgi:hypothetical protein
MMNEQQTTIGNATLWASAFIITALVLVMSGRHTPRANAEGVNSANGFTLLTTLNGQGSEFLYLIDDESSMLIVYSISNPQLNAKMEISAAWYLPSMFNTALN